MNKRRDPEQDLERLLEDDGGEFGAIYKRLSHPEPPRQVQSVIARAFQHRGADGFPVFWIAMPVFRLDGHGQNSKVD